MGKYLIIIFIVMHFRKLKKTNKKPWFVRLCFHNVFAVFSLSTLSRKEVDIAQIHYASNPQTMKMKPD